jgi:hypothetical protein
MDQVFHCNAIKRNLGLNQRRNHVDIVTISTHLTPLRLGNGLCAVMTFLLEFLHEAAILNIGTLSCFILNKGYKIICLKQICIVDRRH